MNLRQLLILTALTTSSVVESASISSKSLKNIRLPKKIIQNQVAKLSSESKNSNEESHIFRSVAAAVATGAALGTAAYHYENYSKENIQFKRAIGNVIPDQVMNRSLFKAIIEGDVEKIKTLILMGADVNCRNRSKHTPLLSAIYNSQYQIAVLLINAGAQTCFEINTDLSFEPKSLLTELFCSDKIDESNHYKDDLVRTLCRLNFKSKGVFDPVGFSQCMAIFNVNEVHKPIEYTI